MNRKSQLIILNGHFASGKSTIGKFLSSSLKIPYLDNDIVKESLFSKFGWSNRDFSKRISKKSQLYCHKVLNKCLSQGKCIIVENIFRNNLEKKLYFEKYKNIYNFSCIQILCRAGISNIEKRFKLRQENSARHPGHSDHELWEEQYHKVCDSLNEFPLFGDFFIELNTNQLEKLNLNSLVKRILAFN